MGLRGAGGRGRGRGSRLLLAIGLLFLAAALGCVAYGAGAAGASWSMALGELWFRIDAGSLNLMQAVTQRYVHPALWDPVAITILLWPAWAVFGGLAAIFLLLARLTR